MILADSRWRVELGLGRALESAGRDLERRAYRYRDRPEPGAR
ncbi:MAG: hypothetical protein R3F62_20025 [Planctomycetota bacterium]